MQALLCCRWSHSSSWVQWMMLHATLKVRVFSSTTVQNYTNAAGQQRTMFSAIVADSSSFMTVKCYDVKHSKFVANAGLMLLNTHQPQNTPITHPQEHCCPNWSPCSPSWNYCCCQQACFRCGRCHPRNAAFTLVNGVYHQGQSCSNNTHESQRMGKKFLPTAGRLIILKLL